MPLYRLRKERKGDLRTHTNRSTSLGGGTGTRGAMLHQKHSRTHQGVEGEALPREQSV